MKRTIYIIFLMLAMTSCSSVLPQPEALDNCAIWQGYMYLDDDYIDQRVNDFQSSFFENEDEIKCEREMYREGIRYCNLYDYDNRKEFDKKVENKVENLVNDLWWLNIWGLNDIFPDAHDRVRKKLKANPDYVRKSLMSIIGTKREYLDYIPQHIELLEWAYDEENSTKKFDSYIAIYELSQKGNTFSYSCCRVVVREDGSERYTELSHEKRYEDL